MLAVAIAASLLGSPHAARLFDDFTTYNSTIWEYADGSMGTTDGCKVWYLKNHSEVNASLSAGAGFGLRMLMSSTPCYADRDACHGAKMAADHIGSNTPTLYGDYLLVMRAPYALASDGTITTPAAPSCNPGVYAYFTAGYVNKDGKWNEMNFGFHPDRDRNGTAVSCEHHDDSGKYHETTADLGFNCRSGFNTFVIRLRKGEISWLVGPGTASETELRKIHTAEATLTEPMTTRIILRTNFRNGDPGYMPEHHFEIKHFEFQPFQEAVPELVEYGASAPPGSVTPSSCPSTDKILENIGTGAGGRVTGLANVSSMEACCALCHGDYHDMCQGWIYGSTHSVLGLSIADAGYAPHNCAIMASNGPPKPVQGHVTGIVAGAPNPAPLPPEPVGVPCNADLDCSPVTSAQWRCKQHTSTPTTDNNCHLPGPGTQGNNTCACTVQVCGRGKIAPENRSMVQYLVIGDSISLGMNSDLTALVTADGQ